MHHTEDRKISPIVKASLSKELQTCS
uniref:Uncharacterized protein n=1 Tax=Rhizophora mucronata TaxID=61149 RepID=A0A2P2QKQ7_RHIMU